MSDNRLANSRKNLGEDATAEHLPIATFHNSYDHIGYGNHDVFQAMEHIKILKTKKLRKELGRQC